MSHTRVKNERTKRKYFEYLKEAKGYSDKTITAIEKAVWNYEEFTSGADYREFSSSEVKKFKQWLSKRPNKRTKQTLSLSTQYDILRHLKDFFTWLSGQAGYKSKIKPESTHYLRLDKKQTREAISPKTQRYPSLEQVKHLCQSITINTEVDQRDRALIAFTLLSGMRDKAIITLPLGCFDSNELRISQEPSKGVETKFNKQIISSLFKFDDTLISYVLEWYEYLKNVKRFANTDPLFPRTKLEQESEESYCFVGREIEQAFWSTTNSIRNVFKHRAKEAGIEYFSPHKFRHTATNEAMKYARTAEEIRAISQNLGHDDIGTTIQTYGRLTINQVASVIGSMSFDKQAQANDKKLQAALNLINAVEAGK